MNDNVSSIAESTLEQITPDWFESMGYQTAFGPDISPDSPSCERGNFDRRIGG
jgi:hypothetical protein